MKFTSLVLCCLFTLLASAQNKEEVEERIEAVDFPEGARRFAESLFEGEKIHWIKERNQNGHSYEAKAKFSNVKYSLEFDDQGTFEDLEFVIKSKQLPKKVKQEIEQYLSLEFERFKIRRIQEQWSGDQSRLKAALHEQKEGSALKRQYELEVHGKRKGAYADYEYLFDGEGSYISSQEIQESNHDNFFY